MITIESSPPPPAPVPSKAAAPPSAPVPSKAAPPSAPVPSKAAPPSAPVPVPSKAAPSSAPVPVPSKAAPPLASKAPVPKAAAAAASNPKVSDNPNPYEFGPLKEPVKPGSKKRERERERATLSQSEVSADEEGGEEEEEEESDEGKKSKKSKKQHTLYLKPPPPPPPLQPDPPSASARLTNLINAMKAGRERDSGKGFHLTKEGRIAKAELAKLDEMYSDVNAFPRCYECKGPILPPSHPGTNCEVGGCRQWIHNDCLVKNVNNFCPEHSGDAAAGPSNKAAKK